MVIFSQSYPHFKVGSPVFVVITQAYNLAASSFPAFIVWRKCISRYFLHQTSGRSQIVTIQEIIEANKCLNIRLSLEVLKSAEKQMEIKAIQTEIFCNPGQLNQV